MALTLGRDGLSRAIVNALQLARMTVLPSRLECVVALIGSEHAALCSSLPRAARQTKPVIGA